MSKKGIARFDLNDDGFIDGTELTMIAGAFGACKGDPRYERRFDFNKDGCIDGTELTIIAELFGQAVRDDDEDDD